MYITHNVNQGNHNSSNKKIVNSFDKSLQNKMSETLILHVNPFTSKGSPFDE